ncbi:WXG100 family type VII secretion target [Streptomyces sp. NPDC052301]|uniref:WXG100 family type VII secretion target n=1 Tax=Streptomyces sp. NPDC052301 TaxID=3365687 RepID=UPI0037D01DBC
MADQPTPQDWKAHLKALNDAIGSVKREAAAISATMGSIDAKMKGIGADWNTPAYMTFDEITSWFHTTQHDLENLLADIVSRMTTSYRNYHHAESANYVNLKDGPKSA